MSLPIVFMVHEPAPLINVFWWHAAASQQTNNPTQASGEPVAKYIPASFADEFADTIERYGIRGKFSVLPFPAGLGLGKISEGWKGCDLPGLEHWLNTIKTRVVPLMDITPEILTHAQAVDIDTMQLLPENERDWASHQDKSSLQPYIATALRFLKEVGIEPTGVTSPWNFGIEVEDDYRAAIRGAFDDACGLRHSWYFLHVQIDGTKFHSEVVYHGTDEWLVSIASQASDFIVEKRS